MARNSAVKSATRLAHSASLFAMAASSTNESFAQAVTVLTMLIGAIGLSLALLHGIEAALWAEAYPLLGALDTA